MTFEYLAYGMTAPVIDNHARTKIETALEFLFNNEKSIPRCTYVMMSSNPNNLKVRLLVLIELFDNH